MSFATLARPLRWFLPLLIGLVVGGAGVSMFLESMPGAEGSPQERADKLEVDLKRARDRIAALEAEGTRKDLLRRSGRETSGGEVENGRPKQTLSDRARRLAEDFRDGRPVSPEDIYRAFQPVLRDVAPIFDRMRVKQQQHFIDSMSGELARKYGLSPRDQARVKEWFDTKANEEARRWSEMIGNENTRLQDLMYATQNVRPDEGLDAFMEGVLTGDKLTAFRTERMAERAERVQQEADARVQRLDGIVGLDEAQRDQVFGIMARSSRDYDPRMTMEGATGAIGATPAGDPLGAMLSVLRPDQRVRYEAERQRRRDEAAKELAEIGLTLPPGWDMFDERFW